MNVSSEYQQQSFPVGHFEKLDVVKSIGTVPKQGLVEQIRVVAVYTVETGETYEDALARITDGIRMRFLEEFRFEAQRLETRVAEAARMVSLGLFDNLTMTISTTLASGQRNDADGSGNAGADTDNDADGDDF